MHRRHGEQLKEHAGSAAPALPVVGWGLQCQRHFCLCGVSGASLMNNEIFPECFRWDAREHAPTFPLLQPSPQTMGMSAHQQLFHSFVLEQLFLESHLK